MFVFSQSFCECSCKGAKNGLQRPPAPSLVAWNGNGLLYCIMFMMLIDPEPSSLCIVQCHLASQIQTSISLRSLFNIYEGFSQLQNRYLKSHWKCQRVTFSSRGICVDKHETMWFRYFMSRFVMKWNKKLHCQTWQFFVL